jgi:prepilin-type N-terminal cleavage/methylation domain-containing protein
MLRWNNVVAKRSERGDTLIEVTLALAILGMVLLGSTAIAATAFRTGQTARERTQIAAVAQSQLEALRSFRDNHTWAEFQTGRSCGSAGGYCGINQVQTTACSFDASRRCFFMELRNTTAGTTEWVPRPGSTNANVPTSVVEISTNTPGSQQTCGYDFLLTYSFEPLGGGTRASNRVFTRLANLKYDPNGGLVACP